MKGIFNIFRKRKRVFSHHRILNRIGHPPKGEDRWAENPAARRWVLCDGASEGWRPAAWAASLAAAIAERGLSEESLAEARRMFRDNETGEVRDHTGALPEWLTQNAEARGSSSTILLVETHRQGRTVSAKAVGDTCLFILEGFTLKESFPITKAETFTSFPPLLSSDAPESFPWEKAEFSHAEFSLRPYEDPSFILVSDGLAEYLLGISRGEKQEEIFSFLSSCTEEEFRLWGEGEIKEKRMKDDDLTLLWVGEK